MRLEGHCRGPVGARGSGRCVGIEGVAILASEAGAEGLSRGLRAARAEILSGFGAHAGTGA